MKPLLLDLLTATTRAVSNTFVLLVVILTIALSVVGRSGDAWFLASTISLNTVIAIFQEMRAKVALRKLELLAVTKATVRRGDKTLSIDISELRVGDNIVINTGEQVPADGQIIEQEHLSVDQSLLTGEAREIELRAHDLVYAGSTVITGRAIVRITALGEYTRAGQMTKKLKWYENKLTPLQKSLNQLIRFLTYVAVLLGVIIYFDGIRQELDISGIFSSIASGALSVVPEGLLLASTLLFSFGALKLVKEKVLIQRISAIEGFSRLDILCLDKTGTLTSSHLTVDRIYPTAGHQTEQIETFLQGFIQAETATNSTFSAIKAYLKKTVNHLAIHESLPFSSSRKYSAILLQESGRRRAIALGAPEILLHSPMTSTFEAIISHESEKGNRILALVDYGYTLDVLAPTLKREGKLLALLVLQPKIRADADDTIFYLQAQGVSIKIISGDSIATVQATAKKVGVLNWETALSGDQLANLTHKEWEYLIPRTTIFARVLPEQKERIIQILQKQGFIGMVGDGVNDTLALKQADISFAMAEGSQAARQVADVVLLRNSFASLPIGMRLGSQVILGVEMISCLFFNKILANSTILLITLLTSTPYPFTVSHLLLLNIFTVGIPAIIWSLVPAKASKRLSADGLIRRSLLFTLPNGFISGLAAVFAYSIGGNTAAFFVSLVLGLVTFWLIPQYLHAQRNKNIRLWPVVYCGLALLVVITVGQVQIIQEILHLSHQSWLTWTFTISLIILASLAMRALVYTKKTYIVRPA